MKLLWNVKDGGPESKVWVWGIESKWIGSVLLLKFAKGSREAYHTHAFNAVSWLLRGRLNERTKIENGYCSTAYSPSIMPIYTPRERLHQVLGKHETNWVLTFRGPWVPLWLEHNQFGRQVLTHGRRVLSTEAIA